MSRTDLAPLPPGPGGDAPRAEAAATGVRAAFIEGFWACAPFILIIVPFSLLFGVVAREAGLDILQAMAMSVLVIAGASQFTALALLQDQAPVFIVLLTSLAVNLRMAMYSAALVPHLGHASRGVRAAVAYLMVDQAFAVAIRRYEQDPPLGPSARVAFYFGGMSLIAPLWYAFTLIGAVIGRAMPAALSLDFAVPVCFIALLAPLLRTGPHILAALVSALGAIAFAWVPWSLGIIIAALLAMIAGRRCELWLARRERAAP
ncbi:branched-chain amino acid ABC transporter permease [Palleronia sediminis]|uniref:Branched-chain amino acid ABC transporter permease n=1 Tax=Palleronia sediminis TaxID=2547833 RepID=A0A4R6AR31_9RHOB|nr:AzlC family ABC transporter permease [Palleronia sediminis]TDL84183.1 branched-chain amino acid ABC transporter permease [Palleronia sediminis]